MYDGTRAARYERAFLLVFVLTALFGWETLAQVPMQRLANPEAVPGEWHGYAIALDGDVAAVSDPRDGEHGEDAGAVHLYRWDGATWQHEAKLTPANHGPDRMFGRAVALDGDVLVVGANDDFGSDFGAAYLFRWDGAAWQEEAALTSPDGEDGRIGDAFGEAVALADGVAFVADTHARNEAGDPLAGAVHVFRHTPGAGWLHEATLRDPETEGLSLLGSALAVSDAGEVLVAGAYGDDDADFGNLYQGAAFVFRFAEGAWHREQKIVNDPRGWHNRFGEAVAISGDGRTILVGDPGSDQVAENAGGARLYTHNLALDENPWEFETLLTSPVQEEDDRAGRAVALNTDGSLAAVGNEAHGIVSGMLHLFRREGGGWTTEDVPAPQGGITDRFGDALAVDADGVMVGAYGEAWGGAAYLYDYGRVLFCVDIEDLQAGPFGEHWMFDNDATPFIQDQPVGDENDPNNPVHAYDGFAWNADAHGNGTCESGGSGRRTTSTAIFEQLDLLDGTDGVSLFVDGLGLSSFEQVNVVNPGAPWDTPGEAGDERIYDGGFARLTVGGATPLVFEDVQFDLTTHYPDQNRAGQPVGDGGLFGFGEGGGEARIDGANSDPAWVAAVDPEGTGRVAFAFASIDPVEQSCYGTYDLRRMCVLRAAPEAEPQRVAMGVHVREDLVVSEDGGTFRFKAVVQNVSPEPLAFDTWVSITLPDGRTKTIAGPARYTLDPDEKVGEPRKQYVPGTAPEGTYGYRIHVGSYPEEAWASEAFTFDKTSDKKAPTGFSAATWTMLDALNSQPVPSSDWLQATGTATDLETTLGVPADFVLDQNYPNPFNPTTTIRFALPQAEAVRLAVYDMLGREVRVLIDGPLSAGQHTATFEAGALASGMYLYRIEAGSFTALRQMLLVK